MRLPLIKHIVQFIEENDSDYIQETISVLENLTENSNIKDDEMDVIGEILSNLYGATEVSNAIERGASKKVALNDFMKRVQGSID
ncbi:MAG: hypothetical protein P8Q16_03445 [Flavobacteriales bacterium]|jgi:hypothetical protein|nr:hypothetical protein [Flavobacteriales bacterium]MDG1439793.1 hypothetical protein [Flavobacteriales bacterium]MDG1797977.1 hypothetical protein [Flavobacteriales bacterium]